MNKYLFIVIKNNFDKKYNIYELNPTIEQLFNKNVHLIEGHYIPLWHNEINIDKIKIKIIPNIPDYIDIDMDIHIDIDVDIILYIYIRIYIYIYI